MAALHEAAKAGDIERVRDMVKAGGDMNVIEDGVSALLWPSYLGHSEVVQLLVLAGQVDVNLHNTTRISPPLVIAAQKGHVEIVRVLLTAKANVHASHGDAIVLAAERGHVDTVGLLLAARANANIICRSPMGRTPLTIAACNNHIATVKVLLDAGADADARDENGVRPADYALERNEPILYALLDPAGAKAKGAALREEFGTALLVHVLSTRFKAPARAAMSGVGDDGAPGELAAFRRPASDADEAGAVDPRLSSRELKRLLEADEVEFALMGEIVDEVKSTFSGSVKVFDPNADNAFLMSGDPESANAIWLRNWREVGLENARRTGGAVIQLVVAPGLSEMQIAEASMTADRGVRVVRIDCRRPFGTYVVGSRMGFLWAEMAMRHPEVQALRDEAARVRAGEQRLRVPPSRRELEDRVAALEAELHALRASGDTNSYMSCMH